MRTEEEHKKQVEKTQVVIKEAYECVNDMIGLGDIGSPVCLDFSLRNSGIGVNINVFEYDI